ncbi:MAG TPA: hypothetical protein VL068_02920 [Microthrixaceae bacterium]|nr:hypothetical protein [Microthrixaceae bacterium]
METSQTAQELARPMNDLGGRFMLSGRTYSAGNEKGFSGLDFYFCGRAGVLGDVDAATVVSELGFFEPKNVKALWESGGQVMSRDEAAAAFIECGYAWAQARLPADAQAGQFAELVRAAIEASDDNEPALFMAWRETSWPTDDVDRAMHAIHLLRELRGGHHVRAVHAAGIEPHVALVIAGGEGNAEFFGWPEPHIEPDGSRELWHEAEAETNAGVARVLEVLTPEERAQLVGLARTLTPKS